MKALKTILLFYILLVSTISFSQMTEPITNEYSNLSKDSLVQIAKDQLASIISKKGGDIEKIDFSMYQTTVMANDQSILVSFILPIKYLPSNSSYYGNMVVDLKTQFIHIQQLSNPKNYQGITQFYAVDPQENKNVQFVIAAINKSDKTGSITNEDSKEEIIIYERTNHYEISTQSSYTYSSFKVKKDSGKIFDDYHEHLEPEPEEEEQDAYIEITD